MKGARVVAVLAAATLFLRCSAEQTAEAPEPAPDGVTESPVPADGAQSARPDIDLSAYPIQYYPVLDDGPSVPDGTVTIEENEEPLTIVEYGPTGSLPAEIDRPSIHILFSQPIVPLAVLGRPSVTNEIVSINPPLNGVFRWYGTKLLSFDSTDHVLPQREYTVTVSKDTTSLGGKSLTGTRRFSFRTEPLEIRELIVGTGTRYTLDDVPVDQARDITIIFSYPVNLDVLGDYLSVETAEETLEFRLTRPDPESPVVPSGALASSAFLRLREVPPEDIDIRVVLREGARSEPSFIGTPREIVRTYHTLRPFRFLELTSYSWTFPRSSRGTANPVYLRFSHPLDEASLAGAFRTVPRVNVPEDKISVWENEVRISDLPFEPETEYDLIVDASVTDTYGRTLSRPERLTVEVPPARRYAHFPNLGTKMLEAEFPHRIVYEFQNVFDGVWKVGRISDPYESFEPSELVPFDFSGIPRNVRHFEVLDLDPWLNAGGYGYVGVSWNFAEVEKKQDKRPAWAQRNLQVQVTDLGITTRVGYNKVVVLVSSLSTGQPVPEASVSLMNRQRLMLQGATGPTGVVVFDLEPGDYNRYFQDRNNTWQDHIRIRAENGLDKAEFIPNGSHNPYRSGVYSVESPLRVQRPDMTVMLFTDRGVYRPGETVSYRGIDRELYLGGYETYTGPYETIIREGRYDGRTLSTDAGTTTLAGGFYGSYDIPPDASPGHYVIEYLRQGMSASTSFQIANFRRLDYTVSVTKPDIRYYNGDTLRFGVRADYLSGGAVSGGSYELVWVKEADRFRPADETWEDYSFGPNGTDRRYVLNQRRGTLDARGFVQAEQQTTPEGQAGRPYRYRLEARVSDVTDQLVSARASTLVHPAEFYIGAKLDSGVGAGWSPFVAAGETVSVSFALVEPDGSLASVPEPESSITGELYRIDWKLSQQQGVYDTVSRRYERVEELVDSTTVGLEDPEGTFEFIPSTAGLYTIRLSAGDGFGRDAVTELEFYATGSEWIRWGGADNGQIRLKADKEVYSPGDTAKVLLQSSLPEGTYLLTVEREGILEQNVIQLEGSAHTVGVPIHEEYVPVVYVSLSSYSVRSGAPTHTYFEPDTDKPTGHYGVIALPVDTASRRIDLHIDTETLTYLPGGQAEITITAARGGRPVEGAELSFLAVDRGVVDLIDYHIPDPLEFFYSNYRFPLGVKGGDSRSLLMDPVTYDVKDLAGGDADDPKGFGDERSNFTPTAVFEPFLMTDANGEAVVRFTLPDTLTTYRCTAVAATRDRFGFAEAELRVQQVVNVKADFPRRLRVRDAARGTVVLSNMGRDPRDVSVSIESDLLSIHGPASSTVRVAAGGTVGVDFTVLAVEAGSADVVVTVESEDFRDRLRHSIPVDKPAVRESFATIGSTEYTDEAERVGEAHEGVVLPSAADAAGGHLDLALDPSRLTTLEAAVSYLLEYPFGCFEQRASALAPLLLFGDVPSAVGGFESLDADVRTTVRGELRRWSGLQLSNGGFPFWPTGRFVASYYASLRVAHALYLAVGAGYVVPAELDTAALLGYLENPPAAVRGDVYLMLYSVYVRSLFLGDTLREADRFAEMGDELGITGYALLGLSYAAKGRASRARDMLTEIKRFIRPGTQTIDLTETYEASTSFGRFYDSRTERTADVLMLALYVDEDSELVDRLARTLNGLRRNGRWGNTSDTYWALLAYDSLARDEDELYPDFSARVSLADTELVSTDFTSAAAPPVRRKFEFDGPELGSMPRDQIIDLTFETSGAGRLYYTATLTYVLPDEIVYARDQGIGVFSQIEDMEGAVVERARLKAGTTYRQRVVVSSARHRAYLVVRAPLPSGAEVLDVSFVTTARYEENEPAQTGPPDRTYRAEPVRRPIQEIYDNEVRLIFEDFPPGHAEASFLFRTTSGGVYPTPPVRAECMYEPEVFGRSDGRLFVIE